MGLCPLHGDHKPSFLVDPSKNLFYCYGCGRGGDVIRFAELYHQVRFPQALALLRHWRGGTPLLPEAASFYGMQLHRHAEAVAYLQHRGLRDRMRLPQALALLRHWRGGTPLLPEAASFYGMQLHRHAEAVAYLQHRGLRSPELIAHMRIGYAPGGCLRGWLTQLGYPLPALRQAGLVSAVGYD